MSIECLLRNVWESKGISKFDGCGIDSPEQGYFIVRGYNGDVYCIGFGLGYEGGWWIYSKGCDEWCGDVSGKACVGHEDHFVIRWNIICYNIYIIYSFFTTYDMSHVIQYT